MSDVTDLPTQRELRVRRSQALYAGRLDAAMTPEDMLRAMEGRIRAIFARGDEELNEITAGKVVSELTRIADDADARWVERRKRHGSRA